MDVVIVCSQFLNLYFVTFFKFFTDVEERALDLSPQKCFTVLYGKYEVIVDAIDAVIASFEHKNIILCFGAL